MPITVRQARVFQLWHFTAVC